VNLEDVFPQIEANRRYRVQVNLSLAHLRRSFEDIRQRPTCHASFIGRIGASAVHTIKRARALAERCGVNPKTVAKWKARSSVSDRPTGPKQPRSTVLSAEEEAVVVAFRRHILSPLDDCLYALQPPVPHLTRSSLHRCLQRHGISRLPQVEGEASAKRKFKP
jgi:hypothetical protein